MLSILTILYVASSLPLSVVGQAQSPATCKPGYSWMSNTAGATPCLLAATLDAQCNSGNWIITALSPGFKYDKPLPSNGTANVCTCSWASYNLISACTVCQGFPEEIASWGDYSSDCSGLKSASFWPEDIPRPNIFLPYWSTRKPTEWTNQKFTENEAKALQTQHHEDVGPTSSKKASPTGAIVGGVIGGVIVVAAFVGLTICMVRRQRKMTGLRNKALFAATDRRPPHSRNISNMTTSSTNHAPSIVSSVHMPLAGGVTPVDSPVTHGYGRSSVSSQGIFSIISLHRGSDRTRSPSPPPRSPSSTVVSPYTLPPPGIDPDQKRPHISARQNSTESFNIQTPQPTANAVYMNSSTIQPTSKRQRYNPPAYSESRPPVAGGSGPPRHRLGAGHGSVESIQSALSTSNNGHVRPAHHPSNSGSSTQYTVMTPTSLTSSPPRPSRDHKRRPTQGSSEDHHYPRLA